MKKKDIQAILYSTGGVIALAVILVAVNFIASSFKTRLDITADRSYTLTQGTRAILKQIDTPIKIRVYFSQSKVQMPTALKTHAQRVLDLLDEYKQASGGKISVEKLDPEPDSDAEGSANVDGVQGEMTPDGEKLYLGLAVNLLDQTVALPFLSPDREKLLEYDISRAISRVIRPERPVIGIMSPLPVFGQQMNPFMARMGQKGEEPWVLVSELKQDFTVKQVDPTAEKIEDDIKVLVVIHPKEITEVTQYALDQFVLRGGKLIAFLDPNPFFDRSGANQMNPMMGGSAGSSLDKLLAAWGITFDSGKVIADANFATTTQAGPSPTVLSLNADAVNADDPVTGEIDTMLMVYAGAFSGTPAAGLKETVLLKTTKESQLMDRMLAQFAGQQGAAEFKPSGTQYPLAIRLTGKFKTAFPDGKPASKTEEKVDAANKKPDEKGETALKESANDKGAVILVADSDMLNDRVCVQVQEIFGQKIVQPQNGNLTFVQNAVEQLSGDENLIAVRSRATLHRPFTVVKKMQATAEANYQDKIKQLQDSLQETQRKLAELQKNKQAGQRFILSPEQQAEVANYQKKEIDAKHALKEMRKNLRHEIDALEFWLKCANILAMPLIVMISGIVIAIVKTKKTAAK